MRVRSVLSGSWLYSGFYQWLLPFRTPKDNRGILNFEEHSLGLNTVPLILFALSIWLIIKRRPTQKINLHHLVTAKSDLKISASWYFGLLALICFVLTLGPFFVGWNWEDGSLPLPFYWLYQLLPYFKGLRSPARFETVFYLPFAYFIALGSGWLLDKYHRRQLILASLIIAAIVVENIYSFNFSTHSAAIELAQHYHNYLFDLKGQPVLHLPINTLADADKFGESSAYLNWATQTGEMIANFNSGYLPADQQQFLEQFQGELTDQLLIQAKTVGLKYIVIHNLLTKVPKLSRFQSALIVDQPDLKVLDLSLISLSYQICNFDRDFTTETKLGIDQNSDQTFPVLVVKNNSDCYFPSLYANRYRQLDLDFGFNKYHATLKMPPVVLPHQELVASENNLMLHLIKTNQTSQNP